MEGWTDVGAIGSQASMAAVCVAGHSEMHSMPGPINVISRWLSGERTRRHHGPSLPNAATGYAIHHAAATLCAVIYG